MKIDDHKDLGVDGRGRGSQSPTPTPSNPMNDSHPKTLHRHNLPQSNGRLRRPTFLSSRPFLFFVVAASSYLLTTCITSQLLLPSTLETSNTQPPTGFSSAWVQAVRSRLGLPRTISNGGLQQGFWSQTVGLGAMDFADVGRDKRDLDKNIVEELEIAWEVVMSNIGPPAGAADGLVIASPSLGEYDDEPDYYFTWTRDSALTISSFLPSLLTDPSRQSSRHSSTKSLFYYRPELEPLIRAYIESQGKLQGLTTPSGDMFSGGISEPKFNVDGTPFTGSWGRPQRDGPALRVLTLAPYAHYLLDRDFPSDVEFVRAHLYDSTWIRARGRVIKNDLEEVAGAWWSNGYDLWEEVDGVHLFTTLASLRALQIGVTLATRLNDTGAADFYALQADYLLSNLTNFFDAQNSHWKATIDPVALSFKNSNHGSTESHSQVGKGSDRELNSDLINNLLDRTDEGKSKADARLRRGRCRLDCAFPLSVIHAGGRGPPSSSFSSSSSSTTSGSSNSQNGEDEFEANVDMLSPGDSDVLKTLRDFVLSFEGLYHINHGKTWVEGWAVGRYREDIYNGVGISRGNPWFICIFSVAHVLYLAQTSFVTAKKISVDHLSAPFWSDILNQSIEPGTIWSASTSSSSFSSSPLSNKKSDFNRAIHALGGLGDTYLNLGLKYTKEGRMSEQIDRHDGSQVGAKDLTWSYASFIGLIRAREEAREAIKQFSKTQ